MRALVLLMTLAFSAVSCVTADTQPDYTHFKAHRPTSILVLPPINNSIEVGASQSYLSVITRPIAESGFYVFPVALVDYYFRNNGLTEPTDIHQVPLEKFREIFDVDAVFYVTIQEWGNKYQVIQSTSRVKAEGVLIDARTGKELWRKTQLAVSASLASGGLTEMLVAAFLTQIANDVNDATRKLAQTSGNLTIRGHGGFIPGPLRDEESVK